MPTQTGGDGNIYLGKLLNGTQVAVKTLRITASQDFEGKRKLKLAAHELYIWTKCKHPNILELFGVAIFHNQISMISPWMHNGSLTWYINQNPGVDRYALCAQVADGVAYMHLNNVVHGDIKGANILVSEDQTIKLMDFGSSAFKKEYTLRFEASNRQPAFSVRWAAPEFFPTVEEIEAKPTLESDVYALGMTFFEVMSGKVPYHEFTKDYTIMARITNNLRPGRPEQYMSKDDLRADLMWGLMQNTWDHEPQYRPSANVVRDRINMIVTYGAYRYDAAPASWGSLSRINGLETAMSILPEVACLSRLTKRPEIMDMLVELPSMPVAAAIAHGEHLKALEWMEQSRCIIWNQTFRPSTPLGSLEPVDPLLAYRFQRARVQSIDSLLTYKLQQAREALFCASTGVFQPQASAFNSRQSESVEQRHYQLAQECNQLLNKVLNIPDFKDFLSCRRSSELLRTISNGTTVMINLTSHRCDALMLTRSHNGVLHLPLPHVSKAEVIAACSTMHKALQYNGIKIRGLDKAEPNMGSESANAFKKLLELLWETIVEPILNFLGYMIDPQAGELPRLTWCVDGQLSFLPLHAAGHYDRPRCKVSDFVISSYIPALGALRSTSSASSYPHSQLLVVGQHHTPGFSPLHGVKTELDTIQKHANDSAILSRKEGFDATPAAILQAMELCDWVHFACHSVGRPADPIESSFYLQNNTMNLNAVLRKSFKGKGLAFISGCNMLGEDNLATEAVPLASGMLMAGYQSVIASMWAVCDLDAPILADKVYEELLKDGVMDHQKSARALHAAVNHLRNKVGYENFIRWVPYIHIGS